MRRSTNRYHAVYGVLVATMEETLDISSALQFCNSSSHRTSIVSSPRLSDRSVFFFPSWSRRFLIFLDQVNRQVIRPEEQALLSRLVGIMGSLELRFLQERAEDGQLTYRLDPCVIELVYTHFCIMILTS